MLLTARMLADVADVNHFSVVEVVESVEGSSFDIYLQLADASVDRYNVPAGRRYIPAPAAVLDVLIETIDSSKRVSRRATNPFPDDRSIFKLSIAPTDGLVGTFALKLTLTEAGKVTLGLARQAISVRPLVESF